MKSLQHGETSERRGFKTQQSYHAPTPVHAPAKVLSELQDGLRHGHKPLKVKKPGGEIKERKRADNTDANENAWQ